MLHKKVFWQYNKTFGDIAKDAVKTVKSHYRSDVVVMFDGYPEHPTTKDHAHQQRTSKCSGAKEVQIDSSKRLVLTREQFLSNQNNKKNFIKLLSNYMASENIRFRLAEADADLMIVKTAVEFSEHHDVTIIGEDTDLVVLLWHYMDFDAPTSIVVQTDAKKWDIKRLITEVGHQSSILLIYGFLGCDTTSRIQSIGKGKVFKEKRLQSVFKENAPTFYSSSATKNSVIEAGRRIMLALFRKGKFSSLNEVRTKMFAEKSEERCTCQTKKPSTNICCY